MIPATPTKLIKHQILADRLPEHHPVYPQVIENLSRLVSGQVGEEKLSYYLNLINIGSHVKINGLRIEHQSAFQIDWLILHPGFRLLLEVKNMTGSIYFDPHSRQLIRTIEDKKEIFSDPLFQVDLQYSQFRQFLADKGKEHIPTFTASVFVNRNGELKLQDYPDRNRILTGQAVPSFIEKLAEKHPHRIPISDNELFAKWLESQHREPYYPILEKYQVSWNDLIKGLRCPSCKNYGMKRIRMRWQCPHCHLRNTDAHLLALYELAMLTENRITNKLAKEFLGVTSADMVYKLLNRGPFVVAGKNRGAYYQHIDLIPFFRK